jgi:chromosome segregation ATPase
MISDKRSATAAAFGQLQQQQAQRQVEQAEQRLQQLQVEAAKARQEASQANERARSLEVDSDQARSDVDRARLGTSSRDALAQVDSQIGETREQIALAQSPQPPAAASPSPAAIPVVNMQGEVTGTQVNVVA